MGVNYVYSTGTGAPDFSKSDKTLHEQLVDIERKKEELAIHEDILLNKALHSDSPNDVVKAYRAMETREASSDNRKSVLIDPFQFNENFGYKKAPSSLTYDMLDAMGRVHVMSAVKRTRQNQIARFCEPQRDMFATGFVVRKKGYWAGDEEIKKADRKRIEEITEFILNTGRGSSWGRDSFEKFTRKVTADSLILDQMTFECVRSRGGELVEFIATDGSTYRIADTYSDSDYERADKYGFGGYSRSEIKDQHKAVNGYYPSYVQLVQERAHAVFYPWELAFGLRNPTTRLYGNGYGRSELEDLVTIITGLLFGEQYNSNFFRIGAAPKGIMRVKGGLNNPKVNEFRQQWRGMIAGVGNAHRIPVIDAENFEWIDFQKTNRDMEFTRWISFLVSIVCSLYTIDAAEIGFEGVRLTERQPMFESNNANRLKYSRDKGLYPLLKFYQSEINKYIVSQLADDLVFEFVGLEAETEKEFAERVQVEAQNFKTVNEIRKSRNMKGIDGGDIILNPYMQPQPESGGDDMEGFEGEGEDKHDEQEEQDDNPFISEFNKAVNWLEEGGQ